MNRKKILLIAGVSASVLLASSLLVACAVEATGPGQGMTASSLSQAESEGVSMAASSVPASSQSTGQSASSQSNCPASSSCETASSAPPLSSQAPATQEPQSAPPQAQAPASQSECAPAPTPTPALEPAPAPPPASSANIDACLSAAAGWASGNNMAVNDGLTLGGAGYENPIETSGKTDAQVTEHLTYQLSLIHSQLTAMPEFDSGTVYPCYKFVVSGTLIYVLYG